MLSIITGCSSCVYQYNVQPKSFYSCNPSLCNCSLELECSVTMPTEVAGNIAVQWYYLDTVTGQVQTINRHDIVEKWIENNVISTKLQLIDLNDRESFTSYWCSIVDPQYHVAMSNVMQLHSDHMLQSCRSTMDGYSHINTTCASYYRVNKQIKSNIKPTIISCLCVLLVVLVFLWIVVLYKKTKTRNGWLFNVSIYYIQIYIVCCC